MNVRSFVPLIAGLCIGGLALKIGISTLQRAKGAPPANVELWAPAGDIPRGTQITLEMLKVIQFPKDLVPAGAVREKDKLIGRVPRVDAPASLPILEPMLLPPGSAAGVHVPPGLRAVAVKVDEGSGVDFHLLPGSHVDVIGYFQLQEGNKRETVARTLIEDVEVAAVGARISAVSNEAEGKSGSKPARAVTLLVKPETVPILHLAEQCGKIKLSMRGSEDNSELGPGRLVSDAELLGAPPTTEEPPAAERAPLLGWLGKLFARPAAVEEAAVEPAPAPAPEPEPEPVCQAPEIPPWVVQVYRGSQVETICFKDRDSRERVESQPEGGPGAANFRSMPGQSQKLMPGAATPEKLAHSSTAQMPGAEPAARTESHPNIEDQVPQEPSE